MIVRIWREADGFHMDMKALPGEKPPEFVKPPFATAHEARHAWKAVQSLIARAQVVSLKARPDDAEELG